MFSFYVLHRYIFIIPNFRHCQAPSEYLEEMTKEFMNKFVKEKFEQKHVHWAPETFEIHASKRANKPSIKLENGDEENCICNRQKCLVICRICGSYMSSARIRKICSIHPSIDLAEDISQCRFRLVTRTDSDFTVLKSYLPPPSVLNSDLLTSFLISDLVRLHQKI